MRREAEPALRAELALVVDLSKAEALRLIGEEQQGYALVGRHVWPTGA